jgi:hypothetical protein
MLTREEIANEGTELTPEEQSIWLTLFRQHPKYSSARYPDAVPKLAAARDVTAQQLLAALRKIEEIGAGTVKLEGGRQGMDFDQVRDRNDLIAYGLAALFDTSTASKPFFFGTVKAGRC